MTNSLVGMAIKGGQTWNLTIGLYEKKVTLGLSPALPPWP